MHKSTEVNILETIRDDLMFAKNSAATFETYFPSDVDRNGLSYWAHLDTAVDNCIRDLKAMIKERTAKYEVVGVATDNLMPDRKYNVGDTEVMYGGQRFHYDEAVEKLDNIKGTQKKPKGLEYWKFYLREV